MNDGQVHQISAEIGGLKMAVETMTRLWQSQENAASEGRRQVHIKIDTLKDEVRTLTSRVNQMSTDISDIKPDVEGFNAEKLRTEGAKRLGAKLVAALVATAGVIGWAVHEIIGRWFPH